MGIGRALTNLIGNCVATVAIAQCEKDIGEQTPPQSAAGYAGAIASGYGINPFFDLPFLMLAHRLRNVALRMAF